MEDRNVTSLPKPVTVQFPTTPLPKPSVTPFIFSSIDFFNVPGLPSREGKIELRNLKETERMLIEQREVFMEIMARREQDKLQMGEIIEKQAQLERKTQQMMKKISSRTPKRTDVEIVSAKKCTRITHADVCSLVSRDLFWRERGDWPLVSEEEFLTTYDNGIDLIDSKEFPTFKYCAAHRFSHPAGITNSPHESKSYLHCQFPYLRTILAMGQGHIVAAGGSILRALYQFLRNDIDLFLVDITEEKAEQLLISIFETMRQVGDGLDNQVVFTRGENCITADMTEFGCYQFVLRIYPSKSSVIGGFDLGCSAALYDGERFWFTEMGAFCISHRCALVIPSRSSISFGSRIVKYYNLGVTIIFHNFDVYSAVQNRIRFIEQYHGEKYRKHLKSKYIFKLACLNMTVSGTTGKIVDLKASPNSDYSDYTPYMTSTYGEKIVRANIQRYLRNRDDLMQFGTSLEIILDPRKMPLNANLDAVAENILENIHSCNTKHLIFRKRWLGDKFGYFHRLSMVNMAQYERELRLYLQNIYRESLKAISEQANILSSGISFITKNPGRQWTSSFHPQFLTLKQFYGKHQMWLVRDEYSLIKMMCLRKYFDKNIARVILLWLF